MKLGVLTVLLSDMSVRDAMAFLAKEGVQSVEIG